MKFFLNRSVVIFKIDVTYFTLNGIDTKCQTPVTSDVKAPRTLSIALQHVSFPYWNGLKFIRIFHILQKS